MSSQNEPFGSQPIFAFLSNVDSLSTKSDTNVITFDEIAMDFELFQYLFYNTPGKNFSIARSNISYRLFNYNSFTLSGSNISLAEVFLSTYEKVNSTNRNFLSPQVSISLAQEINKVKNIVQVLPYVVSLSYDDLIDSLVNSLVIAPEVNSTAQVTVILSTRINIAAIDLTITLNIPVTTIIPGFVSLYKNNVNFYKNIGNLSAPLKQNQQDKPQPYSLEEREADAGEEDNFKKKKLTMDNFKIDKIISLDSDISLEGGSEQEDNISGSW